MKPQRAACGLLAAAAIMTVGLGSAGAAPGPPRTPARILRGRALEVRPAIHRLGGIARAIGTTSFRVRLPPGARQGLGRWYLLRLKGVFSVRQTGAVSQISVSVNGYAALQLIVSPDPRRHGTPTVPVIDELDLLQGDIVFRARRPRTSIDESSYAELRGLRGGENTITIKEEGFGDKPLVSAVTVLPGSGLYEAKVGPSALSVRAPQHVRVQRGEVVRYVVAMADTGDDARHTRVNISSSSRLVAIVGHAAVEVGAVSEHRPVLLGFTLRGVQTGTADVTVSAFSQTSQPTATSHVTIYGYRRSAAATLIASGALFVPAAAFLLLALRRPRKA
jgi:hypothetical protein